MAGIGFELKKIFGKKTLFSSTYGVLYSAFTTIGPSLVFILLLLTVRMMMINNNTSELDLLFFTAAFTHVFLGASLVSGILNTIVSRYISDRIFEKNERDISAAMMGTIIISGVVIGIIAGFNGYRLVVQDGKTLLTAVAYYLLSILAVNAYNLIIFVSALKEYKKITISYLAGAAMAILAYRILFGKFGMSSVESIFVSLVIGFFVIDFVMIYHCIKAFGIPDNNFFEFTRYFKKYPALAGSSIFYVLALFTSNVIFWYFSDMRLKIGIFSTAPSYDLAMFLATLINLSAIVIFEIKAETAFYDKYVMYLSAIDNGTYEQIQKEKTNMYAEIDLQLFFVYEVQLIITILAVCIIHIIYPYLGLSENVLNMFLVLGMAVYCIICMYCTTIFLYYFEDHIGSCLGPLVSFIIILTGSIICCGKGSPYYPVPVLAGGVCGWIVSFIALKIRMRRLNESIFCR